MIINKIYISSFGKIVDYTFDFNDKINVFEKENGWGKSTICTFIKSMFYGIDDSKRSIIDNERKKFKPWNSDGKFGGYIEFIHNEKPFRVERFFGNKSSDDTCKIIDLTTGKEYLTNENLGNRLFGIDADGFLSTVFLSQKDFEIKSNTSITSKFNSNNCNEDSSVFNEVVKKLSEEAKVYKTSTGNKGLINDSKVKILSIEQEIESASASFETLKTVKEEISDLERERDSINKSITELIKYKEIADKQDAEKVKNDRLNELNLHLDLLLVEEQKNKNFLNGNNVKKDELDTYFDVLNGYKSALVKENELKDDILKNKELSEKKDVKLKKHFPVIGIIFSLISIAFLYMFIVRIKEDISVGIISLISCLLFCVLAILVFITFFKKDNKINLSNYSLFKDLEEYKNIKENYKIKLDKFVLKFNLSSVDYTYFFNELKNILDRNESLSNEIASTKEKIESLKKEIYNVKDNDLDAKEISCKLENARYKLSNITAELERKKSSSIYLEEKSSKLFDLENGLEDLKERLVFYESEYNIISKTLDFLNLADENLKLKYRKPLEESVNKFLKLLTDKDIVAKVDVDLNVSIEENGEYKSVDFYSEGLKNIFEICKRFALIDILFTKEKPFVVLDDPFSELDDDNLLRAKKALTTLSNDYQIIYMVCHKSRAI